jgi:hypothetical protein
MFYPTSLSTSLLLPHQIVPGKKKGDVSLLLLFLLLKPPAEVVVIGSRVSGDQNEPWP